jgi:predicted hotdog family 3-hydroxylacyl-ACP dehydratase
VSIVPGTPVHDHAAIAARVPHSGTMCLLDAVMHWSADRIDCRIVGHDSAVHPLRTAGGLLSACAIEYAAQAMALHGALCSAPGSPPLPGMLASARQVRLHVARLDGARGPLRVVATLVAGDARQALYRFALSDAEGRTLVEGRAAVLLGANAVAAT